MMRLLSPPPLRLEPGELLVIRTGLGADPQQRDSYGIEAGHARDQDGEAGQPVCRLRLPSLVRRRAVLAIIASILDVDPAILGYQYAPGGKPRLVGRTDVALPHFSVSHSGDRTLIVLSRDGPAGIDLETVDPSVDYVGIAHDFFGVSLNLGGLSAAQQAVAACRWWVELEAVQKASGEGLAALFGSNRAKSVAHNWCIRSVPVEPGFVGAVVSRRSDTQLRAIKWERYRLPKLSD